MRRYRLFLFVFATISFFATGNLFGQLRFGIFADPQLTWFNSDTKIISPNGATLSLNFGFNAERYFAERYAITSGLSMNSMGGNLKYNENGDSIVTTDAIYYINAGSNVRLRGQYISVPLGFKFKTIEIGYVTIYGNIGISGNIRLKGYSWEKTQSIDKETTTEQFNPVFANYYIGGGIQYSIGGPSSLQIGVTYNGGLTDSFKAGHGSITTSGLSLRVGINF